MSLSCPMSNSLNEDAMHSLLLCDFSQPVWHESSVLISYLVGDTFSSWFGNILEVLAESVLVKVVAVMYEL